MILFVSHEESTRRWNICLECPYLIPSVKMCKQCGCVMKFKTKLRQASCPISKWLPEYDQDLPTE